ncbi:MAG: hypothetical protein LC107_01270 [Chitinophagales bacterium]|nr:hypothetical protein [Chitinophagales bacterium]
MSLLDFARVIIYRYHEKGLEIFLINNEMEHDADIWRIPQGVVDQWKEAGRSIIDLDMVEDEAGHSIKTIAIEGDWHDIPSIRGMLKHDIKLIKSIVKENLPESEKGGYFAIKEAFKKVLPQEYKLLKELKDILFDRNTVTNI